MSSSWAKERYIENSHLALSGKRESYLLFQKKKDIVGPPFLTIFCSPGRGGKEEGASLLRASQQQGLNAKEAPPASL